jgi:chromosomal replication initiation ATPase DnaA
MPLAGPHPWSGLDIVDHAMADSCSATPFPGPGLRARQLRRALQTLIEGKPSADGNPLCLITGGGRAALLRDVADWATACGRKVSIWDGEQLGEEIRRSLAADTWDRLRNRVAANDLVVVERVEAIGTRKRLTAFRHLFDAAAAGGTRFCLSLAASPTAGRLPTDLAGRLAGGLVLPLSHDKPAWVVPASLEQDGGLPPVRQPSLPRVFAATAEHYGIQPHALVGPCRSRTVSQARSLAMYLARKLTDKSYSAIGRACGNRDHTTALHGMRITATRLAADPVLAADAAAILHELSKRPARTCRRIPPLKSVSIPRR